MGQIVLTSRKKKLIEIKMVTFHKTILLPGRCVMFDHINVPVQHMQDLKGQIEAFYRDTMPYCYDR